MGERLVGFTAPLAPLSRRGWGRPLAIATLALVAVAGIGSAMAVVSGLTLLSRPSTVAGFQVGRFPLMILAALLAICLVLSAWALPVMLVGFGASRFRGTKGRRGDRTYGTARFHPLRREWWNPDEAVAAALVLRPERPGAEDGLVPWVLEDTAFVHFTWGQLSRHMLVVGATGSGKTTSLYHHLMLFVARPLDLSGPEGRAAAI